MTLVTTVQRMAGKQRVMLRTKCSRRSKGGAEVGLSIDQVVGLVLVLFLVVVLVSGSLVELGQNLRTDSVQQFLRVDSQQRPCKVQRVEDRSVLVLALGNKVLLELLQELQGQLVLIGQSLLTDNGLHGSSIFTNGVLGVQLVRHITVIFSGHTFTNGRLHQTRQRWQHVDRWVHTSVVQLTVDENLALGNVTSQIRDRVSNIVVWHGQDRNLGDGTVSALDSTSSLVDGRQISVHVTRVTSSTWHFFSGSRDFSQGVSVRRHIGQDGQNVSLGLVSQVFGSGQRQSWGDNSLNGWVVSQVQEQRGSLQGAVLLEVLLEESRSFQVHTHSGENNGEILFVSVMDVLGWSNQAGLSTNLSSDFVVWQTGRGENWNLLTSSDRVHSVDGRDTGGDHFLWVDTRVRVNWRTVDVQVVLGENLGALVDWTTRTIEDTAQHVLGHRNLQVFTSELNSGLLDIDTRGTFENLHNGLGTSDFQNLTGSHSSIGQSQIDNLIVTWELDVVQNDQRTIHTTDGVVVDSRLDFEALGHGFFVQFEQFLVRQHA